MCIRDRFYKEGFHATINVLEEEGGIISLLINGKGQGGTSITDLRVNYLLAYLPLLLHPNPKSVLVIGLGTGTTVGHLAHHIKTKVVEIEPVILESVEFFSSVNMNVLKNKNVNIVIDDGRNYLLRSNEKFDIIALEPSDPWQDFSTLLWSKEFLEISKKHLKENGLFVQWVPIYTMNVEDFRSFYHTFSSVFPHVVAFANVKKDESPEAHTSEIILIGSENPIDLENIRKNFYLLDEESREDLSQVLLFPKVRFEGEDATDRILFLLMFTGEEMEGYGKESSLVTDDNLKLEFSTGRNVIRGKPGEIVKDINNFLATKGVRI